MHLFRYFLILSFVLTASLPFTAARPASAQSASVEPGITYSKSRQKLDLCTPDANPRKTGLIFIHGGGFKSGNRQAMLGFCKLLAQGGFPSVTVSYRLTSDGHSFPKALEDISSAVVWMRANAKRLGIDPGKIVLIGYSAGGTLAMSTGLADRSGIAAVVSVAGISDLKAARAETPHAQLRRDIDAYLGGAPTAAASPISQVSRGDPRVLLFHGGKDNLVPPVQSERMAKRLKAAGVPVTYKLMPAGDHGIMLRPKFLKPLLQDMTKFLLAIDKR